MGIFSGIFGTPKKRVTEKEYKQAKSDLHSEGFTHRERDKIDEIFKSDYNETVSTSHPRGLEANEIEARIKWMHENKSKHGMSDEEIAKIEASFKKRL